MTRHLRQRTAAGRINFSVSQNDTAWQYRQSATTDLDDFFRLCGKFGLASFVADDRTRIEAIITAALPYDHGNRCLVDDFNDRAAGSILNGTCGGVNAYDMYGNLYEQVEINADKHAVERDPAGEGEPGRRCRTRHHRRGHGWLTGL